MKRRKFLQSTGLLTTMGYLSQATLLRGRFFMGQNIINADFHKAIISKSGNHVILENQYTSFAFDTGTGTYVITDKLSGINSISDAAFKINEWRSDDKDFERNYKKRKVSDDSGDALALDITLEKPNGPRLLFTVILYHNYGFLNITGGIKNTLNHSIQVQEIYAVSNAKIFQDTDVAENFAMIDGFSGGEPLEYGTRMYSPLTRSNALKSRNNILLTFTNDNQRKVAVLGGLTYHDFDKFAFIEQARRTELEKGADGKNSLLCYLNLPFDTSDQKDDKELLRVESKMLLQRWNYHEFRCEETATSAKSPGDIIITTEHIDPDKRYLLGFSWWNGYQHGDHEDNHQSVYIEYTKDDHYKRISLISNHTVPRFDGVKKKDVEQVEFSLPADAIASKTFKIIFTKGDGQEKDRNVYLSEIWLRDGSFQPLLPNSLTEVKECVKPRISYTANLFAKDPVGKKVDPGIVYKPLDSFYIDVGSNDPFIALEEYGKRVCSAQAVNLSIYDFPTVCLWYAESAGYGNSGAENSTVGAVNEMQIIKDSGFLNYSRVAVRLVPDSYMPDNQQGWWDDEHWQREIKEHVGGKHGRYISPFETSEKWGKAVTELGGIPLTYFQTGYRSEDYAKAYPGHMLFNKTYAWKNGAEDPNGEIFTSWKKTWERNGQVVWGYDYTDPGFLQHLTEVYHNLRKGGVKGLMFDYPSSGWAKDGGMEDKHATTAAAYRNIFKYASDGLGPGAYVHERNMERGSDSTIGLVASMRTENDTDIMDSATVTRCGLRWYKNRVLINQDTDSKNIVRLKDNRDVVRSVLTMCYVVSGRLLLANSFRQFSKDMFWDLTRTFPYHTQNKSARPVDAFVSPIPMVYDFEVNDKWHQVTFFNPDQEKEKKIGIYISGDRFNGSLALNKHKSYYVYDFWNDNFTGKLKGSAKLEQVLRPGEARMMSVREVLEVPQVLSTNRHIMQGYLDMIKTKWNPVTKTLNGISKIVSNDPYVISIASNGYKSLYCFCNDDGTRLTLFNESNGLVKLKIECPGNKEIEWAAVFDRR
ncbi:hypothetical protein FW778_20640 [Ginsengibacter hankyongi]|uniref:Uncharacterized protein n=1 Tax=Ginsengibacter hankyongi TaxID=2607284 RepID=A0A5J5IC36_9BACT|nr:hypothetical protein [Ginsengibacter hankyongi]KAA9035637.1 hypothetical protein FW778_20640 [Ginsengibacter hankyongi]